MLPFFILSQETEPRLPLFYGELWELLCAKLCAMFKLTTPDVGALKAWCAPWFHLTVTS